MRLRSVRLLLVLIIAGCEQTPREPPHSKQMPVAEAKATLEVPLTREQITKLYENRDPSLGESDPWFKFLSQPKTPKTLELIEAWANETNDDIALQLLVGEKNPLLIPYWRARVATLPRGSRYWYYSVLALLAAGQGAVTDECYALLGTTDELDEALLSHASLPAFARGIPLLRAYQRSGKASAKLQHTFTAHLLLLDYEHAGRDEDDFIASGTEEDLALVLAIDQLSAARLEKLFPLLEKTKGMTKEYDLQADVDDTLASGLFELLTKSDAEAIKLAERWSNTQKGLAFAPSLVLVLGLWRESRGELAAAKAIFDRGLTHPPAAPTEAGNYDDVNPQVPYAALMKHAACLLESTGQRAAAIKQLELLEKWARPVKAELGVRLATFAFPAWNPEWCLDDATATSLASMPFVLTAKSSREKNVLRLEVETRNTSAKGVKVKTCAARAGVLPGETLVLSLGDTQLDVQLPECTPVGRTIAAGAKLSATFEVTLPSKLEPGPLDLQLRPTGEQQLHFLLGQF